MIQAPGPAEYKRYTGVEHKIYGRCRGDYATGYHHKNISAGRISSALRITWGTGVLCPAQHRLDT